MGNNRARFSITLLLLLFATHSAAALCLNPFGCSPKTYEACLRDATNKPTEAGVVMAKKLCHDEFVLEPGREDRRRRMTNERAAWDRLKSGKSTYHAVVRALGEPADKDRIGPCTRDGRPLPLLKCQASQWIAAESLFDRCNNPRWPPVGGSPSPLNNVVLVWRAGNPSQVVYVGQGDVAARVQQHRSNRTITGYARSGTLYVTWAAVPQSQRDGVERFLADRLGPLVGDAYPTAAPVAVNLPW